MLAFYPGGPPYEQFFGIPRNLPLKEMGMPHLDRTRLLAFMPDYIDPALRQEILAGRVEAPTVIAGQTVDVGMTLTDRSRRLQGNLVDGSPMRARSGRSTGYVAGGQGNVLRSKASLAAGAIRSRKGAGAASMRSENTRR